MLVGVLAPSGGVFPSYRFQAFAVIMLLDLRLVCRGGLGAAVDADEVWAPQALLEVIEGMPLPAAAGPHV